MFLADLLLGFLSGVMRGTFFSGSCGERYSFCRFSREVLSLALLITDKVITSADLLFSSPALVPLSSSAVS